MKLVEYRQLLKLLRTRYYSELVKWEMNYMIFVGREMLYWQLCKLLWHKYIAHLNERSRCHIAYALSNTFNLNYCRSNPISVSSVIRVSTFDVLLNLYVYNIQLENTVCSLWKTEHYITGFWCFSVLLIFLWHLSLGSFLYLWSIFGLLLLASFF